MQGFMVSPNLEYAPYGIAVIDPRGLKNKQLEGYQYKEMIRKGDQFPASGGVVTKAVEVIGNEATLYIAEIDRDRNYYCLFSTIKVKARGLKRDYPLEISAIYRDTSSVYLTVMSGRNGKLLGQFNLVIPRPEYVPPKPKPQTQSQKARATASAQAIKEERARIQREKEERERIVREEARKKRIQEEERRGVVQRHETLEKSLEQLNSMIGLDSVKEAVSMLVCRIEYEINREAELRKEE